MNLGLCTIFVTFIGFTAAAPEAPLTFNAQLVRSWNETQKKQFPTPLAAHFKKGTKSLVFVGDHHKNQTETYKYLQTAFKKLPPDVVVVEGVRFIDGQNPKKWTQKVVLKPFEDLLKEPGAGPNAARLAIEYKIPYIGGEPSPDDQRNSEFLLAQGFSKDDIQNVQVLQRLPYRRDILSLSEDEFLEYAVNYYRIDMDPEIFKTKLHAWYLNRTKKEFNYSAIAKTETAVNCSPKDSYFQKVACQINIHRDRELVANIEKLFLKFDRVMVVYGTGHFVQEYPALMKAFNNSIEYIEPKKL